MAQLCYSIQQTFYISTMCIKNFDIDMPQSAVICMCNIANLLHLCVVRLFKVKHCNVNIPLNRTIILGETFTCFLNHSRVNVVLWSHEIQFNKVTRFTCIMLCKALHEEATKSSMSAAMTRTNSATGSALMTSCDQLDSPSGFAGDRVSVFSVLLP